MFSIGYQSTGNFLVHDIKSSVMLLEEPCQDLLFEYMFPIAARTSIGTRDMITWVFLLDR